MFWDEMNEKFDELRELVYKKGALDEKTKKLIALSNVVALGCEP